MTIVIRTRGDSTNVAAAARNVIHQLDPDQPIGQVITMNGLMARSVARSRFNSLLLAIFSVVALVMAAVGIYGVMSYSVLQRTHEIGVRMALGAQRADMLRMVFRQSFALVLAGVIFGIIASIGLTRLLTTMLYGVRATDIITYVGVVGLLVIAAAVASYIPARRAMKVDPMVALRYE
jgi:putative ABC transport system permease protein